MSSNLVIISSFFYLYYYKNRAKLLSCWYIGIYLFLRSFESVRIRTKSVRNRTLRTGVEWIFNLELHCPRAFLKRWRAFWKRSSSFASFVKASCLERLGVFIRSPRRLSRFAKAYALVRQSVFWGLSFRFHNLRRVDVGSLMDLPQEYSRWDDGDDKQCQ